jgi:sec-independent protein translocase protein TatC
MPAPALRSARAEMPLLAHLTELRRRLLRSVIAVSLAACVAWYYYEQLFAVLRKPLDQAVTAAAQNGTQVTLSMTTMTDAFTLRLQVSVTAGVIAAAPYLLFHLWRFVTPGLHKHEKRWVVSFLGAATPLFALGVAFAYKTLPQALVVLLGFTPDKVSNIIPVPVYVSFLLRMLLVFGGGFVAPVFIVVLNLAGVLSAKALFSKWRYIILGCALFGAVATPTGDPFNMALVAVPIIVIILGAGMVCWMNERLRRTRTTNQESLADDEPSALHPETQ